MSEAAIDSHRQRRWRLALGATEETEEEGGPPELEGEDQAIDRLLENVYPHRREGGLPQDRRFSAKWFGDIRHYFSMPVVQIIQADLIDRLGLTRMLKEPSIIEDIEPDLSLVSAILTLRDKLPPEAMHTARQLVTQLAQKLEHRLRFRILSAYTGTRLRSQRMTNPKTRDIDWNQTIQSNLKYYQASLRTIIPVHLYGYPRSRQAARRIIILVDQSASMLESYVFSCVIASILASIPSLQTHLVIFDTDVVDLSDGLDDPVDLMFRSQLGGGTDIGHALRYTHRLIGQGKETYLMLISDLYEGGHIDLLMEQVQGLLYHEVHMITLLALDDQGMPDYDHEVARRLAAAGVPSLACTPDRFPRLISRFLNDEPIAEFFA